MRKRNEKPDSVVWDEEKGYYQRTLTYGSNVSAPSIKLDDVQGWKRNQANNVNKQFNKKYEELKEEFKKLIDEVNWNEIVYASEYNFMPVMNKTYHLYVRENQSMFLSLIHPNSWEKKYIGSFTLDSMQKWIKV